MKIYRDGNGKYIVSKDGRDLRKGSNRVLSFYATGPVKRFRSFRKAKRYILRKEKETEKQKKALARTFVWDSKF